MVARLPHGRYAFLASLVVAGFVVVTTLGSPTGAAVGESISEPITAAAVVSEVVDTVVVRASYSATELIAVPAPEVEGADPVVTHLAVAMGHQIAETHVIASIAGRAVIAAQGPFPMYRTIRPNDQGEDVEALQQLLARTGFLRSEPDGRFGRASQKAFKAFLTDRGAVAVSGTSRDGRTQGPIIPKGELAFLPELPAKVASVDVDVGDRVVEAIVRIEAAAAELAFDTTPDVAALLAIGQTVLVSDAQAGLEEETHVRHIERLGGATVRVLLETPEALTTDDIGRNLRAIIRLHETRAALNVPLAAIQTRADGSAGVQVVTAGAVSERAVAVGRVAVGRAVIESGLQPGDRVVVGWYRP